LEAESQYMAITINVVGWILKNHFQKNEANLLRIS
jgi:hypothetical protein